MHTEDNQNLFLRGNFKQFSTLGRVSVYAKVTHFTTRVGYPKEGPLISKQWANACQIKKKKEKKVESTCAQHVQQMIS